MHVATHPAPSSPCRPLPFPERVSCLLCDRADPSHCPCVCVCVCAQLLQSCPTLCDPMDCSPPGSSVHGDSAGRNSGVGCHALLQGIFLTQGSNLRLLCLLHCRQIVFTAELQRKPLLLSMLPLKQPPPLPSPVHLGSEGLDVVTQPESTRAAGGLLDHLVAPALTRVWPQWTYSGGVAGAW